MNRGHLTAIAIAGVVLAVAYVFAFRAPTIPEGAAAAVLTTATATGPIDPDVPADGEPADGPSSPSGSGCLEDLARGDGWAHLCWSVDRDPTDGDPDKDYYLLRLHGSFQGLRWLILRGDFVGLPSNAVYATWPERVAEGQCRDVPVRIGPLAGDSTMETLCGRTESTFDEERWMQSVTWTCEQCVLPPGDIHAIAQLAWVGVPAGDVPEWDLYADAGR